MTEKQFFHDRKYTITYQAYIAYINNLSTTLTTDSTLGHISIVYTLIT